MLKRIDSRSRDPEYHIRATTMDKITMRPDMHRRLQRGQPKRNAQKKRTEGLTTRLAKSPHDFTIEVGLTEGGRFELSIYGVILGTASSGVSRRCHTQKFKSLKAAVAEVGRTLTPSTKTTDTKFTASHLSTVLQRLKQASPSIDRIKLSLREIVKPS